MYEAEGVRVAIIGHTIVEIATWTSVRIVKV
jgi:2',3'-cyclic-nucleotide 2'-phosphodiesterase (5'-nucleotidase family)